MPDLSRGGVEDGDSLLFEFGAVLVGKGVIFGEAGGSAKGEELLLSRGELGGVGEEL